MRTTVELPEELFRQATARAAVRGLSMEDLVAEGLKLILRVSKSGPPLGGRTQFPIIKAKKTVRRLTPEMVAEAEEQLLTEEAAAHGRLAGH